ncbi:META domain protein [Asticcacaulis biprosthecium C19]|uniref:META domain protein n=1 Tax=Asticcacaulis biprosthecium C19 TaxID=715226 RepID=F4QRG5_9CAUL|nr:META domain protein [Asticcacaulis biprosthecium C19]
MLVELNGQPVGATQRQVYMEVNAEAGRVGGSGGCNTFGGSAILQTGDRVRFSDVVSTKMACMQGMEVEQAFFDVLSRADNYSLNGNSLSLNKARMAPLARFEAKD